MGGLRIDTALEHVEVGGTDGVEAAAVDHFQPAGDPLAEGVPGFGYALLQVGAAPVGGALGDSVGGKKKVGIGPGRGSAPPVPKSSQWVTPTAMLWASSSP